MRFSFFTILSLFMFIGLSFAAPVMNGQDATLARRGGIRINVKTLTGKVLPLTVAPGDTIAAVKHQVEGASGIPPGNHRLIFGGKQLPDAATVASSHIGPGSTVTLTLALRGGKREAEGELYLRDLLAEYARSELKELERRGAHPSAHPRPIPSRPVYKSIRNEAPFPEYTPAPAAERRGPKSIIAHKSIREDMEELERRGHPSAHPRPIPSRPAHKSVREEAPSPEHTPAPEPAAERRGFKSMIAHKSVRDEPEGLDRRGHRSALPRPIHSLPAHKSVRGDLDELERRGFKSMIAHKSVRHDAEEVPPPGFTPAPAATR
ncbi:UBL domain-containing protein [Phanerochaete sordida]|uniref:UBL domain-containing protein n=1 Tax=Phanerochaete sordida TaxID=48140 RepID=A0A9P3L9H4_9APHY|nr:UBL domain-containing protein [Phanerochaete sordida]